MGARAPPLCSPGVSLGGGNVRFAEKLVLESEKPTGCSCLPSTHSTHTLTVPICSIIFFPLPRTLPDQTRTSLTFLTFKNKFESKKLGAQSAIVG